MSYVSATFYILVLVLLLLYYILPLKIRWISLLLGSAAFWIISVGNDLKTSCVFLFSIIISYLGGILLRNPNFKFRKLLLSVSILASAAPLIIFKLGSFLYNTVIHSISPEWIVPLGLSFYTMQIIAYLCDVYSGKTSPQKNFLKYALFVSFFPQIIQGPIPRYNIISSELYEGHKLNEKNIFGGLQLIIWGFFLKYMIADKAAVFVNPVFANPTNFYGGQILIAGILYSFQLYCDFLSCVTLSQGTASLFGIRLQNNFEHPYFATSIKDFWRRWHMSFSSWLRDYIYIPLGGNRKGKIRKNINVILTFLFSGLWHGSNVTFLLWGLLHGVYQLVGDMTLSVRESIYRLLRIEKDSILYIAIKRVVTFLLVLIGWIIFRAQSVGQAILMMKYILFKFNPASVLSDQLFYVGLSLKEWIVLAVSLVILFIISHNQEKYNIREYIGKQHLIVRWTIYIAAIAAIVIWGTYGWGFNAQDFIYGGF